MHRRQFLASIPAATGFVGCVATPRDSDPNEATDRQRPNSSAGSPTQTVNVGPAPSVLLLSGYRYSRETDYIGAMAPARDQFVFVRPPEEAMGPPPSAFSLALNGQQFDPVRVGVPPMTTGITRVYVDDRPGRRNDRSGWLAFDVPTVDTETGALVHDETRYPIPEEVLGTFATAPEFVLESVAVPESVPAERRLNITVTVRNEGDAAGRFFAGVRRSAYPKPLTIGAGPDETASASAGYDTGSEGTETIHFTYPGGRKEYEVQIRSSD